MSQFEYLVPFVGFIYALAATDLLISMHRLIIERKNITINAVPILWAIVAFLTIINGWWGFFNINNSIVLENAGQLFLLSLIPMLVFLISSLSLPHVVTPNMSLWDYFYEHKMPFYLCHALYLLLIPVVSFIFTTSVNTPQTVRFVILSSVLLSLIWLKNWRWHFFIGLFYMISLFHSLFVYVTRVV